MKRDERIRKMVDYEVREERELMKESAYLNKLKRYAQERNKTAATRIVNRIHRYERRLERVHNHVLDTIGHLKEDGLSDDNLNLIRGIERDIDYFMQDFTSMTSGDETKLTELVQNEQWEDLERFALRSLKTDIRRWLEIDKALIDIEVDLLFT